VTDLARIDLAALKEDLLAAFTLAVGAAEKIEDLVLLMFRTEACNHECGISVPLMWALEKHGVTIDDYYSLYVPLEGQE